MNFNLVMLQVQGHQSFHAAHLIHFMHAHSDDNFTTNGIMSSYWTSQTALRQVE